MHDHRAGASGRAPQQHLQTRYELIQIEGLDQIVISASLQPFDPVGNGIPRGQHQHRHVDALRPPGLQQRQAIAIRQTPVEHDHIGGDR